MELEVETETRRFLDLMFGQSLKMEFEFQTKFYEVGSQDKTLFVDCLR